MAEINKLEKLRASQLAQKRLQRAKERLDKFSKKQTGETPGWTLAKGATIAVSGLIMLIVALGADILDWLGIGSIPILFDILDLGVWLIIMAWVWLGGLEYPSFWLFLIGFIEFIPFIGDFPPTWIGLVIIILAYNLGWKPVKSLISET